MAKDTGPLWVFGYGSLMWRPGFEYLERRAARLNGYRRRACVLSTTHRGTPERPGVVMGLDRGGACRGIAYLVDADRAREVEDYLDARELVYTGYRSVRVPVRLADGETVSALTYVVIQADHEYIGHLDDDRIAYLMAQGQARRGIVSITWMRRRRACRDGGAGQRFLTRSKRRTPTGRRGRRERGRLPPSPLRLTDSSVPLV